MALQNCSLQRFIIDFNIIQQDLVPHIPPDFLGYKHTDEEVWYYPEDSSSVKMCKCSIEGDYFHYLIIKRSNLQ